MSFPGEIFDGVGWDSEIAGGVESSGDVDRRRCVADVTHAAVFEQAGHLWEIIGDDRQSSEGIVEQFVGESEAVVETGIG